MTAQINQDAVKYLIRTNFFVFVQWAFKILYPGDRFYNNVAVEAMCATITYMFEKDPRDAEEDNKVVFNLPPRILKSFILSVCYPVFVLTRNSAATVICVSYGEELSLPLASLRRRLLASAQFKACFPRLRLDRDTANEVVTTAGGSIYATTVGGAMTGRGARHFVIDDPIKASDVTSKVKRETVNEWLHSTLASRADDKRFAKSILVMQRLHAEDPSAVLLKTGQWFLRSFPAIAEKRQEVDLMYGRIHVRQPGDVLNPDLEPRHKLDELRESMGQYLFDAQYQQNPVPLQGNLFKVSSFEYFDARPEFRSGDIIIQSWDTALTENETSDYTVGVTMLVRGDRYYVLEVVRRRMGFTALRQAIQDARGRYPGSHVLVEKAGSGISVRDDLRSLGIGVIPYTVEGDKVGRAHRVTPVLEAGRIFLPRKAGWLPEFLAEMRAFPTAGTHDDQVDAFVQAINWAEARKRRPGTTLFGSY
jgi:predicted phage terminase large subunit-like protein